MEEASLGVTVTLNCAGDSGSAFFEVGVPTQRLKIFWSVDCTFFSDEGLEVLKHLHGACFGLKWMDEVLPMVQDTGMHPRRGSFSEDASAVMVGKGRPITALSYPMKQEQ